MEALNPSEDGPVPAPRKYPDQLRERAVRMVLDLQADPATARGARTRVAQQLGINKDTLRNWVEREQIDTGIKPGVTTVDQQRINELERENRELRRANEILKTASAFFASMPR
jgi:transposase